MSLCQVSWRPGRPRHRHACRPGRQTVTAGSDPSPARDMLVALGRCRREDWPSLRATKEVAMPLYLIKFSYTPEAWAKLIKEPEDRRETIGALLEAAGGKLHGLWYAFGDHD